MDGGDNGVVDLDLATGENGLNACAYLRASIHIPSTAGNQNTTAFTVNCVSGVKLWVNGELVLAENRPGTHRTDPNLGFVGTLCAMNVSFLYEALKCNLIPIIPSFAFDIDGQPCNVNADDMASGIAAVMKAEKLIYMSDIPGVMDGNGNLIETLDQNETERLIGTGIISGGMIPKVRSIFRTLNQGVKCVHLIDGTKPDSLLKEIMTDTGNGTMFIP